MRSVSRSGTWRSTRTTYRAASPRIIPGAARAGSAAPYGGSARTFSRTTSGRTATPAGMVSGGVAAKPSRRWLRERAGRGGDVDVAPLDDHAALKRPTCRPSPKGLDLGLRATRRVLVPPTARPAWDRDRAGRPLRGLLADPHADPTYPVHDSVFPRVGSAGRHAAHLDLRPDQRHAARRLALADEWEAALRREDCSGGSTRAAARSCRSRSWPPKGADRPAAGRRAGLTRPGTG